MATLLNMHSQCSMMTYRGGGSLASQTAPTAAFNSFRINTRREDLGDCLYRFGSTHTDLGGPIRLQNASDVTSTNLDFSL